MIRMIPPGQGGVRGFTLIELVVVIAIVGILAAVALPRYLDMRNDGHRAAFASTAGAFTTAVSMSNQLCVLRGWAGRDNVPGLGAGNVDFNANCFPSDTNNVNVTPPSAARCQRVFSGIMNTSYTVTTSATSTAFDFRAQATGGNCRFTYRKAPTPVRRFDYSPVTGQILNIVNP